MGLTSSPLQYVIAGATVARGGGISAGDLDRYRSALGVVPWWTESQPM